MTVYQKRLQQFRQLAQASGCERMVILGSAYGRYLCDYEPIFGDLAMVIHPESMELLLRFDWDIPRVPSWVNRTHIHASYQFAEDIPPLLGKGGPIAVVGADCATHTLYHALEACGEIRPVDDHAMALRLRKDDAEISQIRQAVRITEEALEAALGSVAPGISETEIAAHFEFEVKRRGADLAFPSIVASGAATQQVVSIPSNRLLQSGDLVMFDVGAR